MREIENRIADAVAEGDAATGDPIGEMRKQLRKEIAEQVSTLLEQRKIVTLAVAEFVADVRRQLRSEIRQQIGQLRADIIVAKAHGVGAGDVVELQQFMAKRGSDAA